MLTWELLGAVLGAGIASGREVASFFARYGVWSNLGIVVAGLTMMYLASGELPTSWQGKCPETVWRMLLAALLVVTGGAMLSGAGEITALVLPVRGAYAVGIAVTLVLAWFLAHRTQTGLAWISRALLVVLAMLIASCLRMPGENAAMIPTAFWPQGVARAVAYGGFNAALLLPVLRNSHVASQRQKKAAILSAGAIFMILLLACNGVLLRHPALLHEPLPFVGLMQRTGKSGYYLGAVSLYLAILSTLTACLRGLGHKWYAAAGIMAVAMLGFSGVVEVAYPVVGAACMCMLAAAKFTNCSRKPFQSRGDML